MKSKSTKRLVKKVFTKQIPHSPPAGGLRDIAFIVKARLPQINRFFSAKFIKIIGKVAFLSLILLFFLYNLISLPISAQRLSFSNMDRSSKPHLLLAEEFLANNQLEMAEKEFLQVQELEPENLYVREQINSIDNQMKKISQLEKEISNWESLLEKRLNYRDAYLELVMLHFQLKRVETARDYLEKARELDPNFPLTKELEKILK